jgi:DeoR/GlpR family transcriptional regulator of sugar metabolism
LDRDLHGLVLGLHDTREGTAVTSTDERRREIVRRMYLMGYVGAGELAASLAVDASTIRRDLHALASAGLLQRTHGGARVPAGATDLPYAIKEREHRAAKAAIGGAAAALVRDGETLMLDSGSTVYEVALRLRGRRELTVIANDLRIAHLVADFPSARMLVPGGEQLASNYALVSDHAVSFVQDLRVDWTFLGADAIDGDAGITNTNTLEVPLKRAMLASARHTVVVADSSKFNRQTLVRVADLDEVERFITDDGLAPDLAAAYGDRVQRVPVEMSLYGDGDDGAATAAH